MKIETFKNAEQIVNEIERLQKEKTKLIQHSGREYCYNFYTKFKKLTYKGFSDYFEVKLSKEETELLISYRENKIQELEKELESL